MNVVQQNTGTNGQHQVVSRESVGNQQQSNKRGRVTNHHGKSEQPLEQMGSPTINNNNKRQKLSQIVAINHRMAIEWAQQVVTFAPQQQ